MLISLILAASIITFYFSNEHKLLAISTAQFLRLNDCLNLVGRRNCKGTE
jgi:hypothetical protein